jgi:hypothetical protein
MARKLDPAGLVLQHPLLGPLARLDVREDAAHPLLYRVVYYLRPGRVVAVLGGVRDRVPHPGQPALVDQIHDELELVYALVVGELRLVPGLDERLEAGRRRADNPPHSTACSPKRSVSVSSANVVSMMPARPLPMPRA